MDIGEKTGFIHTVIKRATINAIAETIAFPVSPVIITN